MQKKILEVILFFIGIICLSYPILSNFINSYTKTEVVQQYRDDVGKMTDEEKANELKKAQEYNNNLNNEGIIDLSLKDRDEKEDTEYASYLNILNIGNVLAYISIPKINVYLPIYHGVSDSVLQSGIGHLPETSFPIGGKGTHSVLAGHTGLAKATMFDYIDELVIGDKFYIYVLDDILEYEVDDIQVVEPAYQHVIKRDENEDYVTLVTCTPRYINTHRLLVRGKRVENSESDIQTMREQTNIDINQNIIQRKNKMYYAIVIVLAILIVGLLILLVGKPRNGKHF